METRALWICTMKNAYKVQIYFKELTPVIVGAGQFKIHRARPAG